MRVKGFGSCLNENPLGHGFIGELKWGALGLGDDAECRRLGECAKNTESPIMSSPQRLMRVKIDKSCVPAVEEFALQQCRALFGG
jgi:hypothetical protein